MRIKLYKTTDFDKVPAQMQQELEAVLRRMNIASAAIHNVHRTSEVILNLEGCEVLSAEIDRARRVLYEVDSTLNDWDEITKDIHQILEGLQSDEPSQNEEEIKDGD